MSEESRYDNVDGEGLTVLVVDDERITRTIFERKLVNKPYSIVTRSDAQAALEFIEHNDIAVLVSDNQMPGMLGSELIKQVAQCYPTTARIFMSASEGPDACPQTDIYLRKPFNNGALAEAVDSGIEIYVRRAEHARKRE
ncbi:response regulator [Nanoarchaeota archaeon]